MSVGYRILLFLVLGADAAPGGQPIAASFLSLAPELSARPVRQGVPPPPRAITLEQRANLYMARKMYREAIAFYQRALEKDRSNASLWNRIGVAWQAFGNFRKARKAYKRAYRIDRRSSQALNNLGTTFYMQNKYKKSTKLYLRALAMDPDNATLHLNLGVAYFHRRMIDQAAQEYRIALQLDPEILSRTGTFGSTLQTRSWNEKMYFQVAKIFASLDRFEKAIRYLRRALEDGFDDFEKIRKDPDLQRMADYPPFGELLSNPPTAIRN